MIDNFYAQYIKICKKIFLFSNIKILFIYFNVMAIIISFFISLYLFLCEQIKFVLKKILSAVKLLLHYKGRNIL